MEGEGSLGMVATESDKLPVLGQPDGSLGTTVLLSEVLAASARLEASAFNAEAREAVAQIKNYPNGSQALYGNGGLAQKCSKPMRLKRDRKSVV